MHAHSRFTALTPVANEPTREAATGMTAEERQQRTAVERTRRNAGADELASAGPSQLARQSTRAVDTGGRGRRKRRRRRREEGPLSSALTRLRSFVRRWQLYAPEPSRLDSRSDNPICRCKRSANDPAKRSDILPSRTSDFSADPLRRKARSPRRPGV